MVSVVLESRNLLFIHVPKTGGGSISRVLRTKPDAVIHPVHSMRDAEPCVTQLRRRLPKPLEAYRTVAFVRNPWDWTVSGYLHVTQNMPAFARPPAFRQFVLGDWKGATRSPYPTKFADPDAYVAYHTQITPWEHLFPEGEAARIDQLCSFENLASDAQAFLGATTLPQVNRSVRAHYSAYFDAETREIVAARHGPLIARMGYTFEHA